MTTAQQYVDEINFLFERELAKPEEPVTWAKLYDLFLRLADDERNQRNNDL
jgi:hypothetical protein